MPNNSFIIMFNVMRCGSSYKINKKNLRSMVRIFLPATLQLRFSIGGSENDYIRILNVVPQHILGTFAAGKLSLLATESFILEGPNSKKRIELGQKIQLTSKELVQPHRIILAEDTLVALKIIIDKQNLSPAAQNYLESRYGRIEKIEEGKAALIYRTQANRVLKILRPGYAEHPGILRRFKKSSNQLSKLDPASLDIQDIGWEKNYGLYYLVMKYFNGETLKNHLGRNGPLPLPEAISIVRAIAESLYTFQQCGYACRNLTPGNVLLRENGKIKITSSFLTKTDVSLTSPSAQMVIPAYTAPEQMEDASRGNILSDMFSLGVIFHTMLFGDVPFPSNSIREYFNALPLLKSFTVKSIRHIAPQIPKNICKIIVSLLAYNSKQRPTPDKLMATLDKLETTSAGDIVIVKGRDPFSPDIISRLDNLEVADVPAKIPATSRVKMIPGYCLQVIAGKSTNTQFSFRGNRKVRIGRHTDFSINNDPRISREHVTLEVNNQGYWLTDLKGKNGTYIHGQKLATPIKIDAGAEFTIGSTTIRFMLADRAIDRK